MILRAYRPFDYEKIIKLLYDTVHFVNAADYTEAQLDAWAPKDISAYNLEKRLLNNYTVAAEQDGVIIGFGNINGTEYFDCLYVHKDFQRKGVATLIADDIENYFRKQGVQTVTTDASITAKPFFEKRNYSLLEKQNVECRGQLLTNYKMQKKLC